MSGPAAASQRRRSLCRHSCRSACCRCSTGGCALLADVSPDPNRNLLDDAVADTGQKLRARDTRGLVCAAVDRAPSCSDIENSEVPPAADVRPSEAVNRPRTWIALRDFSGWCPDGETPPRTPAAP